MAERFPDIEIYIHKITAEQVSSWLEKSLNSSLSSIRPNHWQASINSNVMDIVFNPNAVKGFASLWFKQNHTPWATDFDCALAANQVFNTEVRCAISSWQEEQGEAEVDTWIKVLNGKTKKFTWF